MSTFIIDDSDAFRKSIHQLLTNKLNHEKNALNLEKGIFNYAIKEADQRKIVKKWDNKYFVLLYQDHLKSVLINLNDKWIHAINSGEILPHKFAFMTHQEYDYDRWGKMIDLKSKRDKNKFENTMSASTDTFTCRKCKGKKCSYISMQTRSADEPSTIFVTCLDCGNRWKTQ